MPFKGRDEQRFSICLKVEKLAEDLLSFFFMLGTVWTVVRTLLNVFSQNQMPDSLFPYE